MSKFTWTRLSKPLEVHMPNGSVKVFNTGAEYETDSACDMLKFLAAVDEAKLDAGEEEMGKSRHVTEEVLKKLKTAAEEEGCIGDDFQDPVIPVAGTTTEIIEAPPTHGDSGTIQGAADVEKGEGLEHTNPSESDTQATNPAPTEEPTRITKGEVHPTHGGEQPIIQTHVTDPVDIFNGVHYIQETDLTIPNTILPLSFTRFYRSGSASYGPFGWNWDHNFNLFIRE